VYLRQPNKKQNKFQSYERITRKVKPEAKLKQNNSNSFDSNLPTPKQALLLTVFSEFV
jgi:hypothetical protein